MSSEIYLVDSYANNIDSVVHRSSYFVKLGFTMFFLIAIVSCRSAVKLLAYLGIIVVLMLLAKLPVRKLLGLSVYPVLFGLVFSVSQAFYSLDLAAVTLLRVFSGVCLMLFFAASSGFLQFFSMLPSGTLRNVFILSYRFFFMIVDSVPRRIRVMEIRGIDRAGVMRRMDALAGIVAHELIHTIEKAERVYRIMLVRGFRGRIVMTKWGAFRRDNFVFVGFFMVVAALWLL